MAVDRAPAPTPTAPPMRARRTASARNWTRMWPLVAPRARRSPISDRRSRTEMIMMLATPTAPTSSATAPRPKKRPSKAPWASAWATRAAEGWETSTSLGFCGLAVAAEEVVDGVDLAGLGAHVDGGGMAVEAEVVLGGGEADEDRGVDVGGEHGGVQDAGHVEPLVVEPRSARRRRPGRSRAAGRRPRRARRRALGRSPR